MSNNTIPGKGDALFLLFCSSADILDRSYMNNEGIRRRLPRGAKNQEPWRGRCVGRVFGNGLNGDRSRIEQFHGLPRHADADGHTHAAQAGGHHGMRIHA